MLIVLLLAPPLSGARAVWNGGAPMLAARARAR
jgi:hypothetical protein